MAPAAPADTARASGRPTRIVSLLPSATEIVCCLGLQDQLVGVTHECDYPPHVRGLPKVTRTLIPVEATSREIDRLVRDRIATGRALYSLDLPELERVRPDLVVTQTLCEVCAVAEEEVREACSALPGGPRILNLEPTTLHEVLESIRVVGKAVRMARHAEEVVSRLAARVEQVKARTSTLDHRPRIVFLEWLDPPFSSGHWTPELIQMAGGLETLGRAGQPSRTLRWEEVAACEPEVVFVACCGFNVGRTLKDLAALAADPRWRELPAVRSGRVYVVDGSHYFSRPGPRLVESLEILAHALHPSIHPLPPHVPAPVRISDYSTLTARQVMSS